MVRDLTDRHPIKEKSCILVASFRLSPSQCEIKVSLEFWSLDSISRRFYYTTENINNITAATEVKEKNSIPRESEWQNSFACYFTDKQRFIDKRSHEYRRCPIDGNCFRATSSLWISRSNELTFCESDRSFVFVTVKKLHVAKETNILSEIYYTSCISFFIVR